jgi:hypothetical protein
MTATSQILFTVEEAFARLGTSKGTGCLLVFNPQESIHIFVENGSVVSVKMDGSTGEEALKRALALNQASYRWIPDAAPPERTVNINIEEYIASHLPRGVRAGKTIKMAVYERTEKRNEFHYYFIPEEAPETRLRVKKVSTVVGREAACDLYIKSFQVSRRHCLLQVTERGLLVKDLESTNGTFINGIPLMDGYITDGDRLSLGSYVMTMRREKIQ